MPGAPLSLPEREEISLALIEDRDAPWALIARRVGRHPTTIAREVTRHGGWGKYRARGRGPDRDAMPAAATGPSRDGVGSAA